MSGDNQEQAPQAVVLPLCAVIFFSVLNGTMFNVAIPSIKAEYALMPSGASWIMTGYIVVFALGSIIYGKLADSRRVRDLIVLGIILFNVGSLVGLFTLNYPMLIAARVLQAAGASAIPALAMIVATRYFPPHLKGRVLGATASTVAFSAGVGPILGGYIAGAFHWRYLFLLTFMTLPLLPYLRRNLPSNKPVGGSFDGLGAALLGIGVTLCLVFVTQGQYYALAGGLALLGWFVWHINHKDEPFIRPALFFNVPFRNTIILTFIATGAVFGMFFIVPLMLSDLYGASPKAIGMVMFPGAMSAALMGILGGRLADKKGGRFMVRLGLVLYIVSFIGLSSIAGMGYWAVGLALVLSYIGFAFLQSSLPHTLSSELSEQETGIGMGIYTLFFFIAGAFSAAVIGKFLDMGEADACLNPLAVPGGSRVWLYSNIYLAIAIVLGLGLILFLHTFRGKPEVLHKKTAA